MAKTREIKRRIKAVGNIQRITKTMQMIATARFQAAQKRATAARPYTLKIAELVGELASALATDATISHPLLKAPEPKVGRQLVLVITSSRGLCGGYNASTLRQAMQFIRSIQGESGQQLDLEVVGKKGNAYFKFNRQPIAAFHSQFTDRPAYDQVDALAERYMKDFMAGKYDAVQVIYMSFLSMARQTPRVLTLLPLRPPVPPEPPDKSGVGRRETEGTKTPVANAPGSEAARGSVQYDFSPGPVDLLAELLPATVKTQLFQAFNEAAVGEQIARMVAMKSATDSAGKMSKLLTRKYNRARQTAITTELSEIVGGAAGVA
jgi:F-type H+-transporting ATPase subunit gamma